MPRDLKAAARQSRDVRHAPQDADLHPLADPTGDEFVDKLRTLGALEPGSAAFSAQHLVGSMAPEAVIEVMGPVGPEGIGITHTLDGVTGTLLSDTPTLLPWGQD